MGECICRDEWTDGSEGVGKGVVVVGWWWGSRVGGGLDRIGGRWVGGKKEGGGLGQFVRWEASLDLQQTRVAAHHKLLR